MLNIKKPIRTLFSIYAFICFLLLMLVLFPIFLAASFFGKIKGGNFIYKVCRFWGDVWFLLIGIHHRIIFKVPHDPHKQYIFVSNHISYLDIPAMLKSVRKQQLRILGKAEMAKIPLFGFIYKYAAVMVDRNDATHRLKSVHILKSILRRNISVFICPEGTFNTTHAPLKNFHDGAFRIAIETQTPIKPILLLDTYDRLHYNDIFSFNPGISRAVYLEETITAGMTIDDVQSLKKRIYLQMEEALTIYKVSWIK